MIRLPEFRLHRPTTLAQALEILAAGEGEVRLVAGGTDLWPNMKRRHQSADEVVSLRNVADLKGIRTGSEGEIRIGSMTLLSDIAADAAVRLEHPALTRAVESISTPAIRNMASLGGNLCLDTRCNYYNQSQEWRESIDFCMKAGGDVCRVAPGSARCWAVSSSDAAPVLCALRAEVHLRSVGEDRRIGLSDLYSDDGIDYLTRRRGEILTEVVVPSADGWQSAFWKLRRRGSIDFAVLSVAASVRRDTENRVTDACIWLGSVASAPLRSEEAEQLLVGKPLERDVIAAAAQATRKVATPMDNADFTLQWRSKMVADYAEAALREIAGLPRERLSPRHGP